MNTLQKYLLRGVRYKAEVRHRPEVNDLLQHPLQGRLVGGSRRNVLDSVFKFDYLSKIKNDANRRCTSACSFRHNVNS